MTVQAKLTRYGISDEKGDIRPAFQTLKPDAEVALLTLIYPVPVLVAARKGAT